MRRPVILIVVILLIVGGFGAWELPNYLRKPSLRTFPYAEAGCRIDLFFDGTRDRKAAVFFRSTGMEILLDLITDNGMSLTGTRFGSLRWTRDRSALVATTLEGGEIESDEPLWAFDASRLVPISTAGRDAAIRDRGGLGERVFSWYDLGKPGRYLYSWQAEEWREQVRIRMAAGNSEGVGDSAGGQVGSLDER